MWPLPHWQYQEKAPVSTIVFRLPLFGRVIFQTGLLSSRRSLLWPQHYRHFSRGMVAGPERPKVKTVILTLILFSLGQVIILVLLTPDHLIGRGSLNSGRNPMSKR